MDVQGGQPKGLSSEENWRGCRDSMECSLWSNCGTYALAQIGRSREGNIIRGEANHHFRETGREGIEGNAHASPVEHGQSNREHLSRNTGCLAQ